MAVIIQMLASLSSTPAIDASALETSISALKSSISALESSLNSLEGSSNRWEILAWSCAFAVGLGIIGEVVVIVSEYRDDMHVWKQGVIFWVWERVCPPGRPPLWRFWFDIISTIIVLVGVFGEAGASLKLASINNQLRSKTSDLRAKSDQLLALITQEAGTAASSAARAQSSADTAEKLANKTRETVDEVGKKAESIEWGLQMSQYFAESRDIRNRDALRQKFSEFKGKDIIFRSYVHDGDGYFLCEDVLATAKGTGVIPIDQCATFPATPPFETGVNGYTSDEATMLALDKVLAATTLYGSSGGVRPGPIVIFVGRKNNAHVGIVPPASKYGVKKKRK